MKFIALGSNLPSLLGGPRENLLAAIQFLADAGFEVIRRAPLYQSAAVPISDQPDFLNTVVQVSYGAAPSVALTLCHGIESRMGRIRSAKNEARVIDIDILSWDGLVQSGPPELPHPRMQDRAFVMLPLTDIAPHWRHPVLGETAGEIARLLPPSDTRKILEQP